MPPGLARARTAAAARASAGLDVFRVWHAPSRAAATATSLAPPIISGVRAANMESTVSAAARDASCDALSPACAQSALITAPSAGTRPSETRSLSTSSNAASSPSAEAAATRARPSAAATGDSAPARNSTSTASTAASLTD